MASGAHKGNRRLRLAGIVGMLVLASCARAGATTVPPGFKDTTLASVAGVTDIAFTSDGRMLVVQKAGVLRILSDDGTSLNESALDLSSHVCSSGDRGFQSVVADPSFATNHYIYIYYTSNKNGTCADDTYPNGPVNRVSRFVLSDSNTVDPLTETVLVDNIPSMGLHQGGDTAFGHDGYLYVTVGDGECDYKGDSGCFNLNDASRDTNTLLGKVLRLTVPNGGIPPDNPYQGSNSVRCNMVGVADPGKVCQETYAAGLRNPWKFAFDPNVSGTRFFIGDVGEVTWEEVDLGQKAADYGWNVREGMCATGSTTDCGPPPTGMTNPIYAYPHTTGCKAITGSAFVPAGAWRPQDDGAFVYADFSCGKIFELATVPGGGFEASELVSGMVANSLSALTIGPYPHGQALYYSSWPTTEIRRLTYTDANAYPKGATPLRVALVPAYLQCTSANSSHGAPLSFGSCTPPAQASSSIAVGTPDANGIGARSTGYARYDVLAGDPGSPGSHADVALSVRISDVRNRSALSDYSGDLQADATLRVTDNNNGSSPSGISPATVEDMSFPFTVPCSATADETTGAICSVTTSANAIVPNAVAQDQRTILELGQVRVFDSGFDGKASTTADNKLFETQGVFVP